MPIFEFAEFRLDSVKRLLTHADRPVALAPRAVDLLCVLVARAGETVEKDELLREVWGSTVVEENTLARNVLLIRKALGETAGSNKFISTVAGRGYRFVHAVELLSEERVTLSDTRPGRLLAGALIATLIIVVTVIAARDWRVDAKDPNSLPRSVEYATRNGSVLMFAVSQDGRTLAYASGILDRQSVHVRDLATNRDTELLKISGLHFMGLTAHGASLFVVARDFGEQTGSVYQIPLAGGTKEKVFTDVDSPVSFSPDGNLAFVREDRGAGESRLMVSHPDGSQARVLASAKLPSYLDYPEWSPNGRHIIATKIDREDNHVLVFEAASGNARRLGGRWGFPMRPRWMPDGRNVVLIARGIGEAGRQLWSMSWPNGETKPITRDLDEYVDLSVSNDGQTLFAVNKKMATSIWTGPAYDPNLAQRIGFGTDEKAILVWTSDESLVYESGGKMWRIAPDGGRRTQLTWDGQSYHPSACRGSGDLVFIHDIGRGMFFNVLGSNDRLLRQISVRRAIGPECSPDGRWIAFVDGGKPGYPLVRVDLDTNREMVLSSSRTAAAAVSADGSRIAQLTEEPDGLHVLPAAGGAPLRSFSLPASANGMSGVVRWTPDGKGIAYVDLNGGGNIWIQPLAGGPPQQYTHLKSERVLSFDWSLDGKQLGMIRAAMAQDVVSIRERSQVSNGGHN